MYPIFTGYLAVNLVASVALLTIRTYFGQPSLQAQYPWYDMTWRAMQLLLLAPCVAAMAEVYYRLVSRLEMWRHTDINALRDAAIGALIIRLAQGHTFQWPWSSLEQLYEAIATVYCFMALALIFMLFMTYRRNKSVIDWHTENFWHGGLFAAYLGLSGIAYFRAASMGHALLWFALAFYGSRLAISGIFSLRGHGHADGHGHAAQVNSSVRVARLDYRKSVIGYTASGE